MKFGRIQVVTHDRSTITGLIGKMGPEFLKDMSFVKFSEIVGKSGKQ
jgi:hypothetical protein